MKSTFVPSEHENHVQKLWVQKKLARPKSNKNPFTVLMPPPNANASLHAGHGMYSVDDVMIRYKRLQGFDSLWIPGIDHAGFETQYVYEKYLAKQNKSRFDFDRETLYTNILNFVHDNSGLIYTQLKRLGFLADWDRSVFALDPHVISYVYETFMKMCDDGLVYKDEYLVNYCTHCGTTLAELEIKYVERIDPLYYLKYGPFVLATVRPETKFGDTAVAVHPKDNRYKDWIGKEIEIEGLIGKFKLKVIGDEYVDREFGTGVVKITPAHDPADYALGKKHNLEIKKIIDITGRLTSLTGKYAGLKVAIARKQVVDDLTKKGLIEKVDTNYIHSVATCYKCGRDIEPLILPNWFINVGPLKKPVIDVVKKDLVKFYPKKFKKIMLDWLANMHDWPISRQIAWGIRMPVWYSVKDNPNLYIVFLDKNKKIQKGLLQDMLIKNTLYVIKNGLQSLSASKESVYKVAINAPGNDYLQETDTFDTWFSSGQWPLVTLREDEKNRYPTDFMGTLSDILKFWISRMILFSLYRKKEIPFKNVYLWPMVSDKKGIKMSKSKGNVINPIDLVDKYGADAFRGSLFFGVGLEGKVILSEDKVRAMRNYVNKIWNIGRFIYTNQNTTVSSNNDASDEYNDVLDELDDEMKKICKEYTAAMDTYKMPFAYNLLYEFIWHRFADYYIEKCKVHIQKNNKEVFEKIKQTYVLLLQMLHPFLPHVTDSLWMIFHKQNKSILEGPFLQLHT